MPVDTGSLFVRVVYEKPGFSPQPTNLAEGYCYPSFRLSVRPSVNIWGAVVCPRHFGMKPFSRVLKLHTVKEYILQMCNVEVSVWSTKKMSKLRGFELRQIWDILGYLYNSLSAALWYEASVLGFWNFTQWMNINCGCATSRFQFAPP